MTGFAWIDFYECNFDGIFKFFRIFNYLFKKKKNMLSLSRAFFSVKRLKLIFFQNRAYYHKFYYNYYDKYYDNYYYYDNFNYYNNYKSL